MGWPPKKTVYGSAVQLCPMSKAETPYETALEYNTSYLDGFVDLRGWAQLYYKAGKGNLKKYAKYIEKLEREGKNPFNNYIAIDVDNAYDTTLDGLRALVLSDLGYTENDIEALSIIVVNGNYDEQTWLKYQLGNFDWDKDNIQIDGITYTVKEYWFDDINTIRVYLVDADGNQIEKTVPAYDILDSTSEPIVAREYLYVEYELKSEPDVTHVYMSPVPANGTTSSYIYTAKNGSTFDYTKKEDRLLTVLPMMPLKEGGNGMGWGPSTVTVKRNLPKNSKFRDMDKLIKNTLKRIANLQDQLSEETDETKRNNLQKRIDKLQEELKLQQEYAANDNSVDLTGIPRDPHKLIKDYYHDSSETAKLYKKAEWHSKCANYNIYKKCMKKAGTTIESHMCSIYDSQCGFNDNDTSSMREQLYDCYQGYGCPMHAIKETNVLTQGNNSFDSVYKRLKADTRHPEIAAYAKYTRYTDDEIFQTDKDGNSYVHKHFAEINRKKYKPMGIKATAKYCFNFFDKWKGTSGGRNISVYQRQGYNYRATHSWKQYKKTRHSGQAKYRYCYDWTATKAQTTYIIEVTYTGRMRPFITGEYIPEWEDTDRGQYYPPEFQYWIVHYKPVFLVKKYECQIESEIGDDINIYESIGGIPVYANYYDAEKQSLGWYLNRRVTPYKHTLTDSNVRIGSVSFTKPALNITMKRLYSLKETAEIEESNIYFAYGDGNLLNTTYICGETTTDDDGRQEYHQYTEIVYKKGYCIDKTSITTAIFAEVDNNKTTDITLIPWTAKDIYYDDTFIDKTRPYTYQNAKYQKESEKPTADRTDIPYDIFTECLFPEKGTTYITLKNDDDWEGERIIFRYFHNINAWEYEEIRVEDYNIDWVVNPREGGQHKAGSLSCLAPDGNSFLPIFIDVIDKLSFQDALVIYQYSSKEYWSYWIKKVIKVKFFNFALSIVFTAGIAAIAALISDDLYFDLMKGFSVVADILSLNFIFKIFGIEDTVFAIVLEFIKDLVLTILTAGSYLVLLVILTVINLALKLIQYVIGRNYNKAVEDFKERMQVVKDKQLELSNLNQLMDSGGLSTEFLSSRVHRFAGITNFSKYMSAQLEGPVLDCSVLVTACTQINITDFMGTATNI